MLNNILGEAFRIAIGGHVRPDGDCVGSCMGLYQYIKENYKDRRVDVYLEEIPEAYRCIEATKDIKHEVPENTKYDLFICLDCGDAPAVSTIISAIRNLPTIIISCRMPVPHRN